MKRRLQYDVVIAGGGVAGIAAAVGASRAGARTLVIERNPYLGGDATHSNVTAYCGFYTTGETPVKVVGGAGDEMLEQLSALGQDTSYEISPNGNPTIKFEPEYMKLAADSLLSQYGIDVLFHSQIIGASQAEGRIHEVICVDDEGEFRVTANSFVDATGDANLAFLARAETVWGNGRGEAQVASLVMRIDHIGEDADLSPEAVRKAVRKAKTDEDQYLTKETGVIIRRTGWDFGYVLLPSSKLSELSAAELSRAEMDTRRQAHAYLEAFRRYLKGMENCRMTASGPALGIREGRKVTAKYQLTAEDVLTARKRTDGIGRGAWKPEIHRDLTEMGQYFSLEGDSYYDIPYGMLCSSSFENLYAAGRNVCADEIAFASVRVMGSAFVTGQAAGVAAALTGTGGNPDIIRVRQELMKQNVIL